MKNVLLVDVLIYQLVIKHVSTDVKYHLSLWMLWKKGACKLVKTDQIVNASSRQKEPGDHCVRYKNSEGLLFSTPYNTVGFKGDRFSNAG